MDNDFKDFPQIMTVEELAAALRIGRNAAYQLVRDKAIRAIKVGRSIRIPRAALIEFLGSTQ